MESKPKIPVRVYEEFEPSTRWERDHKFDTLIAHLPDFRKEQLKVQVTSTNKLRIRGERPLGSDKWSRFRKEFPIASNYDSNEISAKYEGGDLRIKHPKIITPADHQPAESKAEAEAPKEALKPQKSESDSSQAQKKGEEKAAAQEVKPPSARYDQLKNGQEQATQQADPSKISSMEKQPSQKASTVGSASNDVAKTASRRSSEQTSQDADASKITSTEIKPPSKNASKVGSASADATKTASRKSSEKNTEDHFAEEGKSTSGAATIEKDKNLHVAAEKAEKEAAGSSNGSGDKYRVEEMKQALSGLVMEMKQQKKFMNMIVVFLLVLVAWIYARNAIGSIGKPYN